MDFSLKEGICNLLIMACVLTACQAPVDNVVGPGSSGQLVGVSAVFGNAGLAADGSSQATIRVEVFTSSGQPVDGATVTLTTSLGTLGSTSLTTANGAAATTLTSGKTTGLAFVVATVDNVSATTAVPIVTF
ncbi:MAG: invasin domain 3-containing protein [Nitrospinaceae bacterium]